MDLMVASVGLEPTTLSLGRSSSIQLSYEAMFHVKRLCRKI